KKLAYGTRYTGCDYEVLGLLVLKDQPHGFDIFLRVAPVTFGVQISQLDNVLFTAINPYQLPNDLLGYELVATTWAFVVEQNPVAGKHVIALAVVHHRPVGELLCNRVRAARIKRCLLVLRNLLDSEEFARASLIELDGIVNAPSGIKKTQSSQRVRVGRIGRILKTGPNVALGR